MEQTLIYLLTGLFGIFFAFWLLKQPYVGIAFTAASLAIVDLLPEIPLLTSAVPLVGAITLVGYLISKRGNSLNVIFKFERLHIIALLFLLWIFISNPQAAWFGASRNWMLTYIQLWVLMYLAGELLNTEKKQQVVMIIFSVLAIMSAFYAIQTGVIGETFDLSVRAEGFVDNSNAAARYFVVAMVFLTHLRSSAKNPVLKLFYLLGIIITYLGVFYTVSRTGMILLFAAQGLILFFQTEGRQRIGLIFIFIAGLVLLWFLAESIFGIIQTIIPIIINREDTFGLRINLWKAGWMMWLDHPISGVGVGRYIEELRNYMWRLPGPHRTNAVAHNLYVSVLSETGFVGLIIYISMIITTFKNFWNAKYEVDSQEHALRNTWLIAFLVMLIGGITKSDQADKLIWMVMGLSVYFSRQGLIPEVDETAEKTNYLYQKRTYIKGRSTRLNG